MTRIKNDPLADKIARDMAKDPAVRATTGWQETVEQRLGALESVAHQPFDFTDLVQRLEAVERAVRGAQ